MREQVRPAGRGPVSVGLQSRTSQPFGHRIEARPWFEAGRAIDGESAWAYLRALRENGERDAPAYCVYVHVPFCASICRYCALYTRAVHRDAHAVFDEYIERVCAGIASHPYAGGMEGPTTVHFGGGTPLQIGLERFAVLTNALKAAFGDHDSCEWALETTTSSITPDVMAEIRKLGFRRVHLGVQTLDNGLREHNGIRESGETALEKVRQLVDLGFLCSTDLIMGFENSTEEILRDDLQRLYAAGVRMFSVCELRHRNAKALSARQHEEHSMRNYQHWATLWLWMERMGLHPIHQGQFARSQEDNLYFTHPARGEDCVAIGPYSHGSASRLYYGNKLLPGYYAAISSGASPIDTAVLYDDGVETIRNLERELMVHRVRGETLDRVASQYPEFSRVWSFWETHELLKEQESGGNWTLSQSGSWFIGNMVMQARGLVA